MSSSDASAQNRAYWDRTSDEYQARNADFIGRAEPRWGMWQIPESELRILDDVEGKDVLELGCGAAQWSILLAGQGARTVGLDNSARQLEHARRLMSEAGVEFPLVHSAAEAVPLGDESFDVVFCDHGAMTFADPNLVVPEVARLLRPRGLFAFSHRTPIDWVCYDEASDTTAERLLADYFGMHRADDEAAHFNLPYGAWIRLFRANGLLVEDLVEVQPPEGASSTYRTKEDTAWARKWPMEQIWKVRKP
jgi:ubiquinone/menaquinone biosynthesis C-methylase UbiE